MACLKTPYFINEKLTAVFWARFFGGLFRQYPGDIVGKGVFETRNLSLYSYAAQNPLKYLDPDGNYVVSAYIERNYPKAAKQINSLYSRMTPEKITAFQQITGAQDADVSEVMKEGSGPFLSIMSGKKVAHTSKLTGNIGVNIAVLEAYENGEISDAVFDLIIEHETAHSLGVKIGNNADDGVKNQKGTYIREFGYEFNEKTVGVEAIKKMFDEVEKPIQDFNAD